MAQRLVVAITLLAPDDADPDSVAGYVFDLIGMDPSDTYVTEIQDYDVTVVPQ